MTPPSAIASSTRHAKAGPEPDKAVHASKCFSSRKRHRPMGLKSEVRIFRSSAGCEEVGDGGVTTVIPSRIWHNGNERALSGVPFEAERCDLAYLARSVGHCSNHTC